MYLRNYFKVATVAKKIERKTDRNFPWDVYIVNTGRNKCLDYGHASVEQ